jgi:hypothetical protein
MSNWVATNTFITTVLRDHNRIATNVATHRAKCLRNVQIAAELIDNHRPWTAKNKEAETEVLANAWTGELPADFLNWGKSGGLYFTTANQRPLTWIPYSRWKHLQRVRAETGTPRYYTDVEHSAGVQLFGVYPNPTANTSFYVSYQRSTPVFTDDDPGGLTEFPERWHETLYQIVVRYQMKDSGSIQGQMEQDPIVKAALKKLTENERSGPQTSPRLVPYGFGRGLR